MSKSPSSSSSPAHRVRRQTMASDVRDVLHELILLGEIEAGNPLRLEQLARQLNVSVSPVREALSQLESLGLVEHVAYKGARVTTLSSEDMRDVYEARLAIESLCVRKAAERYDEAAEKRLLEALAQLAAAYQSGDRVRIVYGNSTFHLALAKSSGSRPLALVLRPALEVSQRYSAAVISTAGRSRAHRIEAEDHMAIVNACRSGDPDAAEQALRHHISGFAQLVADSLPASPYVP